MRMRHAAIGLGDLLVLIEKTEVNISQECLGAWRKHGTVGRHHANKACGIFQIPDRSAGRISVGNVTVEPNADRIRQGLAKATRDGVRRHSRVGRSQNRRWVMDVDARVTQRGRRRHAVPVITAAFDDADAIDPLSTGRQLVENADAGADCVSRRSRLSYVADRVVIGALRNGRRGAVESRRRSARYPPDCRPHPSRR